MLMSVFLMFICFCVLIFLLAGRRGKGEFGRRWGRRPNAQRRAAPLSSLAAATKQPRTRGRPFELTRIRRLGNRNKQHIDTCYEYI
jgi:hypothetical protein